MDIMYTLSFLRPTSTSVVLIGYVRVCLVHMLFSKRACAQGELAGCLPKLLKVEGGLYSIVAKENQHSQNLAWVMLKVQYNILYLVTLTCVVSL